LKVTIFSIIGLLLLTVAVAVALPPQAGERAYDSFRAEAEKLYQEKSFSRAREVYQQALKLELTPDERRWVELRIAETTLRADRRGSPEHDQARQALEKIASTTPVDLIAATAAEAVGDVFAGYLDPYSAQRWYSIALDYWAGQDDLATARRRYLALVWRMSENRGVAPREVLVNAVKIAESREDRARARFLLAQSYLTEHNPASTERAFELFEEVIALGRENNRWYDDALYTYGMALMQWSDRAVQSRSTDDDVPAADYAKALEVLRRLVREFRPSESEYVDNAEQHIKVLTATDVNVMATGTFLPDSEQELALTWRNAKQIELEVYAIDLTKDLEGRTANEYEWKKWIFFSSDRQPVRRWTHDTNTPEYHPGQERIRLNPRLPVGAYVVKARAGGVTAPPEVLMITDAHILVHSAGNAARVFVSDVETGEPIAGARVRVWSETSKVAPHNCVTDANGLVNVDVDRFGVHFITAAAGARQAWHQAYVSGYYVERGQAQWRIYAFTDRPAYRPNETVQWKFIARVRENERRWITPTGSVDYTITGPRGDKVASGKATLNAYGSFWSELALTPEMALGEYTITFANGDRHYGQAQLFRLEEYKLPEFTVSVSTPEGKQYRLGETIEATIDASYYFGGPVANATVEAVVYQQPLYRYWHPWREYHWYYPDIHPHHGHGQVMTRETLTTDATGRAILRINTPRDGRDTTYRIEARVVDASRREVRGAGSVNVMKQRYTVMIQPEHFLHRPGESVSVRFKAVDANDRPVQTEGTVTVSRRRWKERQYVDEDVTTTKLTTDKDGEATFTFTPRREGYYSVKWTSVDGDPNRARDRVIAETTIWVADRSTTDLGYFYDDDGVQIIVDKETMRPGETANVMIAVPSSGRWVMLTTAAGTILDTRVLKMDGTVKLVQIPLEERHVPNFFLTASSIFDVEVATAVARVVVPPVEHFLTVDVKADRERYEPRQEGKLTITTRDATGKPVPAEVAIAVSDEAVTAIQADLAGDPRQFFFNESWGDGAQASAGLHQQNYVKLSDKELEEEGVYGSVEGGVEGGVVGGAVGGVATDAVSESITVTASVPMTRRMEAQATMAPAPPPAPPPPPAAVAPQAAKMAGEGAAANTIDVVVRSDFRSTAFWKPDVVTDANGTATVSVKFPEALTTWRATARAATTGAAFGMGSSTARTNLPLLVRLQAPRFFVVGDRATVSAVINNNTDQPMTVTPSLELDGLSGGQAIPPVQVPANGEARADWTVAAEEAGQAKLRVTARSATHGDAMEKTYLVYEHGIDKLIARSGKLRGQEALVRLELPRERRSTDLVVQVAPTLAVTLLDALPYLLEFPYGCTEQTMSRFLPAAIVARTIEKLGLDVAEVSSRAVRGIPSPLAGDPGPSARSGMTLDAVTAAGMKRLYDMQHANGAWGWWKEGPDDEWMTAYVVWGFSIAREGGLPVDTKAVDRAAAWLAGRVVQRRGHYNDQSWILHALSAWRGRLTTEAERTAANEIWEHRERLTPYGRALFALALHRDGQKERTAVLVRNLEDGAVIDRTPDQSVLLKGETAAETMATAHWGAQRFWWRWYEGPIETTSFVLQALVTIDPNHRLVEPAMNWLVKNRRGSRWTNTRDTAIALLSLNDYLEHSGELKGDVAYEVTVNGRVVATQTVTAADVLRAPSRFAVDAAALTETTQEIRIRRTGGSGPIYFSAEARFFSLEEPVKPAGNEMFVRREYARLAARPTLLKGVLYDRVPVKDGDTIKSGERVEVTVTVDVKNDYEYLLFEDLKPAGLEAVELQSGQPLYATKSDERGTAWVYQELRDRKVAMFIDRLPQGIWTIKYTLRAEVPGTFHALPLLGQAMYVPDIRANGEEVRVTVVD
jgi:alpha-2-macroglobulin